MPIFHVSAQMNGNGSHFITNNDRQLVITSNQNRIYYERSLTPPSSHRARSFVSFFSIFTTWVITLILLKGFSCLLNHKTIARRSLIQWKMCACACMCVCVSSCICFVHLQQNKMQCRLFNVQSNWQQFASVTRRTESMLYENCDGFFLSVPFFLSSFRFLSCLHSENFSLVYTFKLEKQKVSGQNSIFYS